jgi:hypothetical protein
MLVSQHMIHVLAGAIANIVMHHTACGDLLLSLITSLACLVGIISISSQACLAFSSLLAVPCWYYQ